MRPTISDDSWWIEMLLFPQGIQPATIQAKIVFDSTSSSIYVALIILYNVYNLKAFYIRLHSSKNWKFMKFIFTKISLKPFWPREALNIKKHKMLQFFSVLLIALGKSNKKRSSLPPVGDSNMVALLIVPNR